MLDEMMNFIIYNITYVINQERLNKSLLIKTISAAEGGP